MLSLIIDTETTGVNPHEDRICELGFILTDWKTVRCAVHTYVNPEIPFDNTHNRLNSQAVAHAPTFLQIGAFAYLLLMQADEYVAYNWAFDRRFIRLELERAGLTLPSRPVYDPLLATGRRTLEENCRVYGVRTDDLQLHSAMDDCMALLRLSMKMRPRGQDREVAGEAMTLGPRFS